MMERKRKRSLTDVPIEEKVIKLHKNEYIEIGHLFCTGPNINKVVPQIGDNAVNRQDLKSFESINLITLKKAFKKPKGKGYSIGNYGNTLIVQHNPQPNLSFPIEITKKKKMKDVNSSM